MKLIRNNNKIKKILSIAGSDSSSGAGIQADIKTVQSLGGYCLTSISIVTSQNSKEISDIFILPTNIVMNQIITTLKDFKCDAVKIGVIPTVSLATKLYDFFKNKDLPIVVDPVYKSTSGLEFTKKKDFIKIQKILNKFSSIILPNLKEAEILANMKILNIEDMKIASKKIVNEYKNSILLKGLTLKNKSILDLLYKNNRFYRFEYKKNNKKEIHGTGCTLSTAIAFYLAKGFSVRSSVKSSKRYIADNIQKTFEFVSDNNPIKH
ncbi:bifunctional hydroxymethylpyrimidine kinase/phosphomethylpyrimidine kinase [Rickettsiales bacterium]|nr:bifunctional hydroxymethylpyrimidine kinase/phosphomethylpyrimidine kinase [Rickettsiales bacterium]